MENRRKQSAHFFFWNLVHIDRDKGGAWSEAEVFYAPASIDRGHIVLPVSVCLSAENFTCELNIFL